VRSTSYFGGQSKRSHAAVSAEAVTGLFPAFHKDVWLIDDENNALKKCTHAEALGRKGGFASGYCWHESVEAAETFRGTPLRKLEYAALVNESIYPSVYGEMLSHADREATLPKPDTDGSS